jgi:hypothetical protein
MTRQAVGADSTRLVAINATVHRQLDLRLRWRTCAICYVAVTGLALDLPGNDVRLMRKVNVRRQLEKPAPGNLLASLCILPDLFFLRAFGQRRLVAKNTSFSSRSSGMCGGLKKAVAGGAFKLIINVLLMIEGYRLSYRLARRPCNQEPAARHEQENQKNQTQEVCTNHRNIPDSPSRLWKRPLSINNCRA